MNVKIAGKLVGDTIQEEGSDGVKYTIVELSFPRDDNESASDDPAFFVVERDGKNYTIAVEECMGEGDDLSCSPASPQPIE